MKKARPPFSSDGGGGSKVIKYNQTRHAKDYFGTFALTTQQDNPTKAM